jgi:hypothetical protein
MEGGAAEGAAKRYNVMAWGSGMGQDRGNFQYIFHTYLDSLIGLVCGSL